MANRPILVSYPQMTPKKMTFIGSTRKDWTKYIRWLKISPKYNENQKWNKYLQIASIYLEPSKYIDGRSRHQQTKIQITIEEIE